ncbi:divergent polysaccharide deacetylase family protein [Bacillus sp. FJAT-45350]|uniref:divergent polysaccharide deacetylase family protein n=1 Tax=Bacillus sp. FJAT-45350 TaxID=2011014 RepID=UPI000BB7A0D5|nr:divergent polysaccharide deacetylase family protein [Bacillus sp. FJAT-45350]
MRLSFVFFIITLSLLNTLSLPKVFSEDNVSKAAIIIDDFGGDVRGVNEFFDSQIPITVAVMPFLSHSNEQAEKAHEIGLEVIVHLPLEPKKGKASWLGPNPITSDLSLEEVKERVNKAIEDVPHAVGINNHMGSKIVEDEKIMRAILEVAKEKGLYVVDSGTSGKSVIPTLAEELHIPWGVRDIFLDDTLSNSGHVEQQMKKLARIASKQGQAIGIGHVGIKGEATVAGVKQAMPYLKENHVEVVPASHLLDSPIDKDPEKFWHKGA